jgi:hypothetical protein
MDLKLLSGMKIEATELIRHPQRPLRLNRLRKNAINEEIASFRGPSFLRIN